MNGFALGRPAAMAALAAMIVNDHVLKSAFPGWVTGKLSDVAGMIFFPLVLHVVLDSAWRWTGRPPRSASILVFACVATAVVFTLTKTTALGNDAFRVTWAILKWPLRAARLLCAHGCLPGLGRVVLVRDPTDLIAAPFAAVAFFLGRTRSADEIARRLA